MVTILIADDDPDVLDSMRMCLESKGYETVCALDGKDAMRKSDEKMVDLALIDIYMPHCGGLETIMKISGEMPVIAMSGVTSPRFEPLEFAESLGASASLEKPFKAQELLDAVDLVLKEKRS